MTISQGTQFGPYRIVELIGSGGMGEVYRALDTRLEREVALKLVSESYLASDAGSGSPSPAGGTPHTRSHLSHERFLREARSAATLSHANICAIHDVGEQDGRPYLVMELLRGETLKQYLKDKNRAGGDDDSAPGKDERALSAAEVIAFSQQAASALVAAHSKGIVHRDIKPANLFVNDAGRGRKQIKILDFGLAKKQGTTPSADSRTMDAVADATATGATAAMELTSPGSAIGTIAYMSPEQAKGLPLDARTDLFSLGSVMYEMATGEKPFSGASTAEVFVALLTLEPRPVTALNPAMPVELDGIVAKLLAKDPANRYQTAEDLLQDLEALDVRASDSSSGTGRFAAAASGTYAAQKSGQVPAQTPTQASGVHPVAEKTSGGGAGKLIAAGVIVLLLVAGGFAWWKYSSPKSMTLMVKPGAEGGAGTGATPGDKSAIIVADFVNQTGDPVFETTLNQALGVQLGQSPVLDIVSQQHLRQSLQYLGRKPDETITPAIAREIGEREGIKAILTGTISKLGNEYLITLAAQNTATGDQIASVEAQAASKEKVLDALNEAAAQMRAKLGESLASIAKLNTPFGQATTPSLEAFRAYALGDAAHQKGNDIPEAQDHYKRALELDPKLAMAYARLGVILLNSGQHGKAMEYFTKAHQLSGDVSERERLYIEGHYYSEVLGNMGKAIETLQVAAQEYPLQVDNFVNLGALYEATGEPEKAQQNLMKALALQGEEAVALADVMAGYVQLDQLAEAEKIIADEKKLGINDTGSYQYQLALYGVKGDKATLQKLVAETAGRPDQFLMTSQMGVMQAQWGQFKAAVASLKQSSEEAGASGAPDAQAGLLLNAAWVGWPIGECDDPAGAVKSALALDKSKPTQIAVAATEAYCGNAKAALPALDALEKKYPEDTLVQKEIVPQGRAYLALQAGEAQKALDQLARSQAFDLVSPGPYLRGMAYLQLKDAASAVVAFKIATKYKGVSFLSESNLFYPMNYYALSLLGLGRAYAMAGDKVNAKAAYDKFFVEWKDADPGLEVVAQARKEYAAL